MIVERTWVCAAFNGEIVNKDVDVIRGHAGLNVFAGKTQDVGSHIARVTHAFDDVGSLAVVALGPGAGDAQHRRLARTVDVGIDDADVADPRRGERGHDDGAGNDPGQPGAPGSRALARCAQDARSPCAYRTCRQGRRRRRVARAC